MAKYKYTTLSDEERRGILEARLRQFETEHFNHEINKLDAQSLPEGAEGKEEKISEAEDAQATIESAIETVATELSALEPKNEEPEE